MADGIERKNACHKTSPAKANEPYAICHKPVLVASAGLGWYKLTRCDDAARRPPLAPPMALLFGAKTIVVHEIARRERGLIRRRELCTQLLMNLLNRWLRP